MMEQKTSLSSGAMLNAYPDSIGGTLQNIIGLLQRPEMSDAFRDFYILPSIFNTDLDRGFSVIDYSLNENYAGQEDLDALHHMGITLKFDLILNHASVLSPQFQDLLSKGEASPYKDFFINWNKFWEGHGAMTPEGYIQPDDELIRQMFFRKPGLPILMVRMPDGSEVPYWNTFYQEIRYPELNPLDLVRTLGMQYMTADRISKMVNAALLRNEKSDQIDFGEFRQYRDAVINYLESCRLYLGQMDLNVNSPIVWEFYEDTLRKLAGYGAQLIRLDAFAYASKKPGARNFLNDPETWDILSRIRTLAGKYNLAILPEIHSSYEEKTHEALCATGCMTYDFFFPGLLLDAFEHQSFEYLLFWINEILTQKLKVVNMLGCHDGIPLLDLKGLLPEERIMEMVEILKKRGGLVKDLHGVQSMYYQVNCTYFSALGESDRKMLLARALQIFMPGKPQVWYLDLFAGKNDIDAVKKANSNGHKEINRTNLTTDQAISSLQTDIVQDQLALLRFRNTCPAFSWDSNIQVQSTASHQLTLTWSYQSHSARLTADLSDFTFCIQSITPSGEETIIYQTT